MSKNRKTWSIIILNLETERELNALDVVVAGNDLKLKGCLHRENHIALIHINIRSFTIFFGLNERSLPQTVVVYYYIV